jgi:hypothetical protein
LLIWISESLTTATHNHCVSLLSLDPGWPSEEALPGPTGAAGVFHETWPSMRWHIYHDGSNRWRWELLDAMHNLLLRSSTSFQSREDCLKDAQSHGYEGTHHGPLDHGSDELDEC